LLLLPIESPLLSGPCAAQETASGIAPDFCRVVVRLVVGTPPSGQVPQKRASGLITQKSLAVGLASVRLPPQTFRATVYEISGLEKILTFFADHWDQALRYLRKKGMGKHRRGSNSESGMRLLRRLEKNHDGIRSAATRQHYIQIYQAIKYLSLDIAEFIEKGPQMTGPPRV
jgi:hypothetical protein